MRKFDHPEEDMTKCLLPLPTSELGRLSIPEEEREEDEEPLQDGGDGPNCRTVEEALEEYSRFMDAHNIPQKVRQYSRTYLFLSLYIHW